MVYIISPAEFGDPLDLNLERYSRISGSRSRSRLDLDLDRFSLDLDLD